MKIKNKKKNNFYTKLNCITIGIFSGVLVAPSYAQKTQSENVTMSLGEVVVTGQGSALSPRQVLTSVNVLTKDRIENQTNYSNYELINQVPGVMLGEYAGKGVGFGTSYRYRGD
jgi:outer membrane cobalamin receptor